MESAESYARDSQSPRQGTGSEALAEPIGDSYAPVQKAATTAPGYNGYVAFSSPISRGENTFCAA